MKYIIDTNILLYIIRENQVVDNQLIKMGIYEPRSTGVSIVTFGEILAMSKQNNWGINKMNLFEGLTKVFTPVPVQKRILLDAYAEIDTYSRGKLSSKPLPRGLTSRVMGKNDLWIAATTYLTKTTLVTTDNDFDHLNGVYFNVIKPSIAV